MANKEQARFVVGGVYRRPRPVGGWQSGVLVDAVEEVSGRRHGRVFAGGEIAVGVTEKDMQNWELVSEPGSPLMQVGPKYAVQEDIDKAVAERVALEVAALRDRMVQIEAENVGLRTRLLKLELQPEPGEKAIDLRSKAARA